MKFWRKKFKYFGVLNIFKITTSPIFTIIYFVYEKFLILFCFFSFLFLELWCICSIKINCNALFFKFIYHINFFIILVVGTWLISVYLIKKLEFAFGSVGFFVFCVLVPFILSFFQISIFMFLDSPIDWERLGAFIVIYFILAFLIRLWISSNFILKNKESLIVSAFLIYTLWLIYVIQCNNIDELIVKNSKVHYLGNFYPKNYKRGRFVPHEHFFEKLLIPDIFDSRVRIYYQGVFDNAFSWSEGSIKYVTIYFCTLVITTCASFAIYNIIRNWLSQYFPGFLFNSIFISVPSVFLICFPFSITLLFMYVVFGLDIFSSFIIPFKRFGNSIFFIVEFINRSIDFDQAPDFEDKTFIWPWNRSYNIIILWQIFFPILVGLIIFSVFAKIIIYYYDYKDGILAYLFADYRDPGSEYSMAEPELQYDTVNTSHLDALKTYLYRKLFLPHLFRGFDSGDHLFNFLKWNTYRGAKFSTYWSVRDFLDLKIWYDEEAMYVTNEDSIVIERYASWTEDPLFFEYPDEGKFAAIDDRSVESRLGFFYDEEFSFDSETGQIYPFTQDEHVWWEYNFYYTLYIQDSFAFLPFSARLITLEESYMNDLISDVSGFDSSEKNKSVMWSRGPGFSSLSYVDYLIDVNSSANLGYLTESFLGFPYLETRLEDDYIFDSSFEDFEDEEDVWYSPDPYGSIEDGADRGEFDQYDDVRTRISRRFHRGLDILPEYDLDGDNYGQNVRDFGDFDFVNQHRSNPNRRGSDNKIGDSVNSDNNNNIDFDFVSRFNFSKTRNSIFGSSDNYYDEPDGEATIISSLLPGFFATSSYAGLDNNIPVLDFVPDFLNSPSSSFVDKFAFFHGFSTSLGSEELKEILYASYLRPKDLQSSLDKKFYLSILRNICYDRWVAYEDFIKDFPFSLFNFTASPLPDRAANNVYFDRRFSGIFMLNWFIHSDARTRLDFFYELCTTKTDLAIFFERLDNIIRIIIESLSSAKILPYELNTLQTNMSSNALGLGSKNFRTLMNVFNSVVGGVADEFFRSTIGFEMLFNVCLNASDTNRITPTFKIESFESFMFEYTAYVSAIFVSRDSNIKKCLEDSLVEKIFNDLRDDDFKFSLLVDNDVGFSSIKHGFSNRNFFYDYLCPDFLKSNNKTMLSVPNLIQNIKFKNILADTNLDNNGIDVNRLNYFSSTANFVNVYFKYFDSYRFPYLVGATTVSKFSDKARFIKILGSTGLRDSFRLFAYDDQVYKINFINSFGFVATSTLPNSTLSVTETQSRFHSQLPDFGFYNFFSSNFNSELSLHRSSFSHTVAGFGAGSDYAYNTTSLYSLSTFLHSFTFSSSVARIVDTWYCQLVSPSMFISSNFSARIFYPTGGADSRFKYSDPYIENLFNAFNSLESLIKLDYLHSRMHTICFGNDVYFLNVSIPEFYFWKFSGMPDRSVFVNCRIDNDPRYEYLIFRSIKFSNSLRSRNWGRFGFSPNLAKRFNKIYKFNITKLFFKIGAYRFGRSWSRFWSHIYSRLGFYVEPNPSKSPIRYSRITRTGYYRPVFSSFIFFNHFELVERYSLVRQPIQFVSELERTDIDLTLSAFGSIYRSDPYLYKSINMLGFPILAISKIDKLALNFLDVNTQSFDDDHITDDSDDSK